MLVLSSAPGRIVALPENPGFPLQLTVEGFGSFNTMQAIITGIGFNETANAQFMHTLRNYIYVYSFGDRIADLMIHGVAATTSSCDADNVVDAEFFTPGIERLLRYWRTRRLSFTGLPVRVTLGLGVVFNAFLLNNRQEYTDVANGISQFTLTFKYPVEGGLEDVTRDADFPSDELGELPDPEDDSTGPTGPGRRFPPRITPPADGSGTGGGDNEFPPLRNFITIRDALTAPTILTPNLVTPDPLANLVVPPLVITLP